MSVRESAFSEGVESTPPRIGMKYQVAVRNQTAQNSEPRGCGGSSHSWGLQLFRNSRKVVKTFARRSSILLQTFNVVEVKASTSDSRVTVTKRRSRAARRREAERLAAVTPHQARTTYASVRAGARARRRGLARELPGGLPGQACLTGANVRRA